ncbi:MAG: AsmA family protein [Gallionella sp.]|nr:AsmA family protein [Gallionella sp.]
MNKILKYGLLGTGAVAGITVAGIAYLVVTFNPNDYKPQIIQAVKDSRQRNLRLDGDIKLSFFPTIGANLSKVSLSEYKSAKEFAAIDSARVSLAFMPLLRRQVVVNEVAVSGLKATLVKRKDGTTNIDDLLDKDEKKQEEEKKGSSQPVKFDIASVSLDKTNLDYRDEGTGAKYAVKDVNLKTGRIAIGVPGKIDLSFGVQANQPRLDITAQLKTTLTFDLDKQKYQLQGLELQASGSALDISSLKVKAGGDVSADLTTQEFGTKKFALNASGVKDKHKFDATLDAPALNLAQDKYSGDKLTLNAKLDAAFGNVFASLSLPGVEGNAQSFKISALTLDMDVKQPEQAFKVKLSSPVSGNIKTQQFDLNKLSVAVNATGDKLPNKSVSSEMKGSVQLDALKEKVQANLAGGLLQSQVKIKAGVNGFADPAINFDVDVDQFDADLYMPKAPTAEAPKAKQAEQPFDLSALRKLKLDGSLRVGSLKAMNVKTTQLRVDVKAHNGLVNVNPMSVNLYQGSAKLSASVNAAPATPNFAVSGNLTGINVAPMLKDAADLDIAEGKGNITFNLTTQGNMVSALKKALDGSMAVNLEEGAIKGINLPKLVQGVQKLGKSSKMETMGVNKDEKTAFSEFKASFKVNNGVARNDDLAVKAPMLRITGNGDIDIGNDSLNYTTKVTMSKTEGGGTATLPVYLSGPYTALKFKVDYGAMISDVAKQKVDAKVEAKKEEIKAKAQEQLKNKLKGLFK